MPEAIVPLIILQRLELEFRAVLGLEFEAGIAAVMGDDVFVEARLVIIVDGSVAERTFAVGPAFSVHLQHAQVQAELDFFDAILAGEAADGHLSRLVIPLLEDMRDVETHAWTIKCGSLKSTQPVKKVSP